MTLLPLGMVGIAVVLLARSLFLANEIFLDKREVSEGWNRLYLLIVAFIVGYLIYFAYLIEQPYRTFHLVVALVFLGGALFVLQATRFSLTAIRNAEESAEQARQHALHDQLTGLPNRALLLDHIQHAILWSQGNREIFSVLVLDMERLKAVNDSLGHHIGDRLLKLISARLAGCVRAADTVARLGGDEFALLLERTGLEEACEVSQKIAAAIEEPFVIDEKVIHLGSSIGIALYPEHGNNAEALLQSADAAVEQSKRNELEYVVFEGQATDEQIKGLEMVWELREAFKQDQFELLYQPKLDLRQQAVVGAEALIRWHHPERGDISPERFVPIAEQMGLMKVLSLWVVKSAAAQMAKWRDEGFEIHVAVNISVRNLNDPRFPQQVRDVLRRYAIPPAWLTLELTEGSMMIEPDMASRSLKSLASLGLNLSIDDFGTGYSSLSYLKQLPVCEVKIDKSFVSDMDENEDDATIVCATIDLAHNLGYRVVAEGVEKRDVMDLLNLFHCDQAQGFYVSEPLDPRRMALFARCHQPAVEPVSGGAPASGVLLAAEV